MVLKEGDKVPMDVVFHNRENGDWKHIKSEDVFKGKTVIVFSLPGAFTPTCSSTHLPRYNELGPVFKKLGVDTIVCLSVNDGFVMDEWQKNQGAENVWVIADGNGEFTEKMGQLVDKSAIGFGKRSWRYSMLVKDGTIDKMFVEPQEPGDPFKVSDADTMLNYLKPDAAKPNDIIMFTKVGCDFCRKARDLLKSKGESWEEVELAPGGVTLRGMRAASGAKTTPQVFINGKHIGGFTELEKHYA